MKLYLSIAFLAFAISIHAQLIESTENYVQLWNGTIVRAKTIEKVNEDKPEGHLVIDSNQPVSLKLVSNYQLNGVYYLVRDLGDGKPAIMERVEHGKISIFEFNKIFYDTRPLSGGKTTNKYVYYLFNNELKPLNTEFLKRDLKDYPEYVSRIKSMNRRGLIHTAMIVSGVCLTAVGVGDMFEKDGSNVPRFNFSPNGPFLIGLALVAAPIVSKSRKKENLEQIIRDFNISNE